MTLKRWLERNQMKPGELGKLIGRHRTTVLRLARGDIWPDRETARLLADATGGKVMPNDFLDLD